MKNTPEKQPRWLQLSARDFFVFLGLLLGAALLCLCLRAVDGAGSYPAMVFLLAVLLISRFTSGYFYGVAAALISVLAVNFLFTYPYFHFNFTLAGYPLTILCMLAVSIITSMLTTQIKSQNAIRLEAETEKMRGNLLRAVSHDLRTPLTGILGASSAIRENDDILTKEERLRLLGEIGEDAQGLIRMVENLLSITRIGEESARIVKSPEAAEELIGESVAKFKKRFPGWTVRVEVPDELLMIPMDPILIEQVLINLLENAVLHAKGAGCIRLSAKKEEGMGVFEVRDDGAGIAKELLPHIFESGGRGAAGEPGDAKRNMGIGLSVCQTIVAAHGGHMTAANDPAGGAVFRFELPL